MEVIDEERPDQRALRTYLESGAFLLGEALGRWKLIELRWPYVIIQVAAAKRDGAPDAYAFRFNCENYPNAAPTGGPWDTEKNQQLAASLWPGGGELVASVFRPDWNGGACLYLPCDRMSAAGHVQWPGQHPESQWQPAKGLTLYLDRIHELLQCGDYRGVRGG
jgi:hypothetical protein